MLGTDIGIDLGTANILINIKEKGIVIREPSVIAIDLDTKKILAIGEEAREMVGRTPDNIIAVKPLTQGVISDYSLTEKMISHLIFKALGKRYSKPNIYICVPSGVTEVERKAVEDAAYKAGGRKVKIIEEPIAAAIGAGLNIDEPYGNMVVDIGGGTTDVAVISLGGIVTNNSLKVAGNDFDDTIIKYIRQKHKVLIGERTAERIKINVGTVWETEKKEINVKGRNLVTGLPNTINVTSDELKDVLLDVAMKIIESIHHVLEKTPPELISDISRSGIILTGGGCLLTGMEELISSKTGIKVLTSNDALSSVVKGLSLKIS